MLLQGAVLSAVAAVGVWTTIHFEIDWRPAPEFRTVTAQNIRQHREGFFLVDVRNPERFAHQHAPDSILFTDATYGQDLETLRARLRPGQQIVVFGEGVGSDRATRIARQLRKDLAPAAVTLLEGGWASWPREGSP